VTRGEAVRLESPLGTIRAGVVAFRWSAVPDAVTYHVIVKAADGSIVFERDVTENSLEITPESGAISQHPGSVYFWEVRAVGGAGADLGRSSPGTFTIARDASVPR
jgi:hypothetical protein